MIESLPISIQQILATIGASQAQIRYVDLAGSDTSGNGSLVKPFLTIAAAVASITDASSVKPYVIQGGVGSFASAPLGPWMYFIGSGRQATTLTAGAANILNAGFSAAGEQQSGIFECAIGYALVCDFAAVASPGAGVFYLYESLFLGFATTWTAGNSSNRLFMQNNEQIALTGAITHTLTNFQTPRIIDIDFRGNSLTVIHNAAYAAGVTLINCTISILTVNCANVAPNTLTVSLDGGGINTLTYVGDGAFVSITPATAAGILTRMINAISLPDVDLTITGNVFSAGATKIVNGGLNSIIAIPFAARIVTILVTSPKTQLLIMNNGTFPITLIYPGISQQKTTYLMPFDTWNGISRGGGYDVFNVKEPQTGRSVLVNGVSAPIPVDITNGTSVITLNPTNFNASFPIGELVALDADITTGTRAGGGQFIVRSINLTTGAAIITDQSNFAWSVVR